MENDLEWAILRGEGESKEDDVREMLVKTTSTKQRKYETDLQAEADGNDYRGISFTSDAHPPQEKNAQAGVPLRVAFTHWDTDTDMQQAIGDVLRDDLQAKISTSKYIGTMTDESTNI
ncbi:Hypp3358 [Branchiostoma lanceolatum]|uniref:Hypp3358 protein n=1 Tax=Branchiostoma lanceolatum TaxID=7740 RepID=A0A8K0A1N6_BRALA|nr:Hypp3358 [Branchiostoma lanceolatum]